MVAFLAEDDPMKLSLNTSTPDDDYRFARHVGRKYGGTDFRYVDKLGESRVGVVLHPVRVNVIDLRLPPGF